jgi:hypothetical protein
MKNLLLVVGTVSILAAPAGAETDKKTFAKKPISVAQVEKTAVTPLLAHAAAAAAETTTAPASSELLAMPDLPVDTSSPLNPFPELDHKAPGPLAKAAKTIKDKPIVMNMGEKYVLGSKREAERPTVQDTQTIIPKSLSQAQVATVVQSHMGEVQQCWNAVPKQLRADACTADLKLSISEAGNVTDIELGGDVPAGAQKCITSAVARWSFPTAETTSDVEYGISLRSL